MNEESEIVCVNENTVDQVFISNEKDDASADTIYKQSTTRQSKKLRRLQQQKQNICVESEQSKQNRDLVQFACGEAGRVQSFVYSYSGMMHYLNF